MFLVLYFGFTRIQAAATLALMQIEWGAAFPPLDEAKRLAAWLVKVHTGSMFAYPAAASADPAA
jgi:hypothetical protein